MSHPDDRSGSAPPVVVRIEFGPKSPTMSFATPQDAQMHAARSAEYRALQRDAARYRKLRASPHWSLYDIVWEEAYCGIVALQGEALDKAVDEMPEPSPVQGGGQR